MDASTPSHLQPTQSPPPLPSVPVLLSSDLPVPPSPPSPPSPSCAAGAFSSLGPPLLIATSCATTLLLVASIVTILVLFSRLRRSEKTIAALHQQLTTLAAAAVSMPSSSTRQYPDHVYDGPVPYVKYDHDSGAGRQYSVADDEAIMHSVRGSYVPHCYPAQPVSIDADHCCSSCQHAYSSISRRPPTASAGLGTPMSAALTFRALGCQSIASAPPSVCATSMSSPGRQLNNFDWSQSSLPSTPTTRTHPLLVALGGAGGLAAMDEGVLLPNQHGDQSLATPSIAAMPPAPVNHPTACSVSNQQHHHNDTPSHTLSSISTLGDNALSVSPPTHGAVPRSQRRPPPMTFTATSTAAAALPAHLLPSGPLLPSLPATTHAFTSPTAPTSTSTSTPPDPTHPALDRRPSIQSDNHAPSFWFQLPPAESSTDLVHPGPAPCPAPESMSLSATLHLGPAYPGTLAHTDDERGATHAASSASHDAPATHTVGVDLSDVGSAAAAGGMGLLYTKHDAWAVRPGTCGSASGASSERDAFLHAGSGGDGDDEATMVVVAAGADGGSGLGAGGEGAAATAGGCCAG